MAAVESATNSMNGDIKFTIGDEGEDNELFESVTLQDEVYLHLM